MNFQQMYDILLKNNLSASQNMFTLYISWRQSNELKQMYSYFIYPHILVNSIFGKINVACAVHTHTP